MPLQGQVVVGRLANEHECDRAEKHQDRDRFHLVCLDEPIEVFCYWLYTIGAFHRIVERLDWVGWQFFRQLLNLFVGKGQGQDRDRKQRYVE